MRIFRPTWATVAILLVAAAAAGSPVRAIEIKPEADLGAEFKSAATYDIDPKLTAPGVPDIYQGTEVWNLRLVDPDNRRPVDYDATRTVLDSIGDSPPALSDDGAAKMFLLQRALAVRAELPEAFGVASTYEPLAATGDHAGRVVAYIRGHQAIAIAPRLTYELPDMTDTTLTLPPGTWTDRFSGRTHHGVVNLGELWSEFPVTLLTSDE